MPNKRRIRKGSFSGHFDHILDHFGEARKSSREAAQTSPKRKRADRRIGSIHDLLLGQTPR